MKILLATAHPYIPQIAGGAQSSMHELAAEFANRGHRVSVLSGLTGRGWLGLRSRAALKLRRQKYVVDYRLGYPVYRAWFGWEAVADVVRRTRAEVVVLQSGFPVRIARALKGTDTPVVIYLHNVETDDLGGSLRELDDDVSFIANSRFTAARFAQSDGISATVIYPMVVADRYRTSSSRQNVTFINPHPYKGLDIALKVAERCPDIPFVFVKAWTLSAEDEATLQEHLARLSNLTIRPPTKNMQSVYGEARILLAPSHWEEAFGRVASEAHLSGIPVVGSDRGGLPEAIGPGGVIVSANAPIEEWVSAIRLLWSDKKRYETVSAAALHYSERTEMKPEVQAEQILSILAAAHDRVRG